ncbi:MAG: TOBE domain-containing protein, partial [Chloroflexi bacterium]|nr:TOBE domain-containing protein [Chloroflexota bacterium]
VQTRIGEFRFAPPGKESAPSGQVVMTIRPEQIGLNDQASDNTVTGRIRASIYVGRYTRYKIALGEHEVEAVRSADLPDALAADDVVQVRFPPERIWVVPAD